MASQEGILAYTQPTPSGAPSPYPYPPAGPAPYSAPYSMPSAYYPGAYSYKKKKSGNGMSIAICILLLLLVVWLLYYMSPARVLTRRLIRAGWVLYTKPGCPYCVRQESILKGKFWKKVSCPRKGGAVISISNDDSFTPPLQCDDPSITGFPYWYNQFKPTKSSAGLKSWAELQKMAN